jgi:hypothetical protein
MAFSHANNVDAKYSSFTDIRADQVNIFNQGLVDTKSGASEIYLWLSAPDPSSNQEDAYEKRQPFTGTWFIIGKQFSDWKNNPRSFIVLYGIRTSLKFVIPPRRLIHLRSWLWKNCSMVSGNLMRIISGFTKYNLSSRIIHEVSLHCSPDPSLAFAYFYFDFNDGRKQLVRGLICSLIIQFSKQCASIPDGLAALYSNCLNGENEPTTQSLMKVLREVLTGFRHVYILVDALDECGEPKRLLSTIEQIISWDLKHLHILATSRPEPVIKDHLSWRVSDTIDLRHAPVDADIQIHIRERLQNDFRLRRWPSEVHEEIEKTLMAGAKGM